MPPEPHPPSPHPAAPPGGPAVAPARTAVAAPVVAPDAAGAADAADDARLVARVAAGDHAAFATLYDRHVGLVHALAHAIVGADADAEDVVAATFAQLWREAGRHDPARGRVTGWLALVARSRALDLLRARRRRLHHTTRVAAETAGAAEGAGGPAHGSAAAAPDAATLQRELAAAVAASLAALPAAQRQAIELAFYGGLSHGEIASSLGEPLGTVKSRLHYATRRLAAEWRAEDDDA